MTKLKPYIPVSCALIDQIEILATYKSKAKIQYVSKNKINELEGLIATWLTKDHVEYLVMADGTTIRLDEISSINGETFEVRCSYD